MKKYISIIGSLIASISFAQTIQCKDVVGRQLGTNLSPSTIQRACMENPKVIKCAVALAKEFPYYITLDQAVAACKQYDQKALNCTVHIAREFPDHVPFATAASVCQNYSPEKIECAIKLAVDFPGYVSLTKALATCNSKR